MSEQDEIYEQYIKDLWPFQQEVIAYAMVAGCHIKKRMYPASRFTKATEVIDYEAFLPDGTYVGNFPDLYEASVHCKIWLMGQSESPPKPHYTDEMFQPPLID